MMTVDFMPMDVTTFLQCRRGRNTYRRVRIDIGMKQAVYNALPQCSLEIVDATGHVWSRGDARENRGHIILDYQGPPESQRNAKAEEKEKEKEKDRAERKAKQNEVAQALKLETKAKKADIELSLGQRASGITISQLESHKNEGNAATEVSGRSEAKDDDDVQQVGGERNPDGETLQRPIHLQVSLVGTSHARLERKEERGSEGSPDGLHSNDDESHVLDDRHEAGVGPVSSADKDSGRD